MVQKYELKKKSELTCYECDIMIWIFQIFQLQWSEDFVIQGKSNECRGPIMSKLFFP